MANRPDKRRQYGYIPGRVSRASDAGPVRPANEDALYISDQGVDPRYGALYIVADGVGGQEHGRHAADLAVQTIPTFFYEFRKSGNGLLVSLTYALKEANKIIYDEAQKRGAGRMGCTVVAVAQDGERVRVAHVGDARAYLVRKGKISRLTKDHTWVQEQVEAGTLTREEAASHELRNVVTRVLGNKNEVEVELSGPFQVEPDDLLLLCSDGLYDALSEREIFRLLQQTPPGQAAPVLVKAAVRAGAGDNVTAVVAAAGQRPRNALSELLAKTLPGGIPLVLPFILLFLGALFVTLLLRGGAQNAPASPPPLITAAPTNNPYPYPPASQTQSVVPTGTPTPTSEALPTVTTTADTVPTLTEEEIATLVAQGFKGCVNPGAWFWDDAMYNDDQDLCQYAQKKWPDDPDAILLIKEPLSIVSQTGVNPTTGELECAPNDMVRVESLSDPDLVGWVLAENAWALEGNEESCEP